MGVDRPEYQVVFLIDLWKKSCEDQSIDQTSICLSVFRVLTYLLSKIQRGETDEKSVNRSYQKLKWGCKFFNSREHKGKIERSQFKSFKLKHFEVFEKEVEKRLLIKIDEKETDDKNKSKEDLTVRKRRVSHGYKARPSTPAENVGKVLSEVFADFQWECPDLMSPGRPHRRKGRPARWGRPGLNSSKDDLSIGQTLLRNLLFVYSSCPYDEDALKSFCGKKCIDSDVFLDSILSTSMLEKLRGSLRLDLLWVDTSRKRSEQETSIDSKSLEKVSGALDKVGGKLIPFEAILQVQSTAGTNINYLKDLNKEDNDSVLFDLKHITPTSSNLDYYLNKTIVSTDKKRRSLEKNTLKETGTAGQLFIYNDEEDVPVCKLQFQSLGKSVTPESSWKRETPNRGDKTKIEDNPTSYKDGEDTCLWRDTSMELNGLTSDDLMTNYMFTVINAVKLQADLVHIVSRGKAFICCGVDTFQTEHGMEPSKCSSSKFQCLLNKIMKQQTILVLCAKPMEMAPSHIVSCLSLLQPLTKTSAQLTVLSNKHVLKIEKQIFLSKIPQPRETTMDSDFNEWREKFISTKVTNMTLKKTEPSAQPLGGSEERLVEPFNGIILERWYPSGRSVRMARLVQKLSDRVKSFDFLDPDEKVLLKQVQKLYRKENEPMLQSQYEETDRLVKLENNKIDTDKLDESTVDEVDGGVGKIVFLEKLRSNSNIVTGSRSEKMLKSGMQKAKKSSTTIMLEGEEKQRKRERQRPDIGAADFQSECELGEYLLTTYNKTVRDEDSVDTCVQSIVLVALHFLKQSGADNPEERLKELMQNKLLISNSQLRQKHQGTECQLTEDQKLLEYKLQIQLQFELTASETDVDTMSDDTIEEVCNMLRKWSLSGKLDIKKYMEEVLVVNYIHTLPRSLGSLYRDLMIPMPDELAKVVPRGDNSSLDDSCLSDTLMSPASSLGPGSVSTRSNPPSLSQPLSNRSDILTSANFKTQKIRKMALHPSLSDIGPKRQIMVAVNPRRGKKTTKSRRSRGPGSARKGSAKKGSVRKGSARKGSAHKGSARKNKKEQSTDSDMKAVRRNLFMSDTKLERRQSVAVMESLKSPLKGRAHRRNVLCSPEQSPKGRQSMVNEVTETPAHKQMSKVLRRKDKDFKTESATVVEESPMKASKSPSSNNILARLCSSRSPARSKIAVLPSRRSFYSAGPSSRSRNLEKYRQLANRIAGRSPGGSAHLKSPDRLFVMKQLKGSPSPSYSLRRTPRKLDTTPEKCVLDSPCQNTRSKTPTSAAMNLVLYRESPKSTARTPKESVTRKLTLTMTPEKETVTNAYIPLLVIPSSPDGGAQSSQGFSTQNSSCSTHMDSPSRTTRSTHMDSPSRNTRLQSYIKPSASVRTLSFDFDQHPKNSKSLPTSSADSSSTISIQSTPVKQNPLLFGQKTPPKNPLFSGQKTPPTTPTNRTMSSPCNSANKSPRVSRQTPPTPASILKKWKITEDQLRTPQKAALKVRWQEDKKLESFEKQIIAPRIEEQKDSENVKTPTKSPKKVKVRTPDFDTWHRRKPRFGVTISPKQRLIAVPSSSINVNRKSPSRNVSVSNSTNSSPVQKQTLSVSSSNSSSPERDTESVKRTKRAWQSSGENSQPKIYEGTAVKISKKTRYSPTNSRKSLNCDTSIVFEFSLQSKLDEQICSKVNDTKTGPSSSNCPFVSESPDKAFKSNKKRRMSGEFNDNKALPKKQCLSGKFQPRKDVTEFDFGKHNEKSNYFSANNADVFISGNSSMSTITKPEHSNTSTLCQSESPKFTRIHSLRKFTEILSSESESGFEPMDSPIFDGQNSNKCDSPETHSTMEVKYSPKTDENKPNVSPASAKMYSPNVTAKGLFTLMNSPIIRSGPSKRLRLTREDPDNGTDSVVRFTADLNTANKKRKTVARSRRSLNLFK